MGAAIDAGMSNKLSVTLIAAKNSVERNAPSNSAASSLEQNSLPGSAEGNGDNPPGSRLGRPLSASQLHQREATISRHGRARREKSKMLQTQLPLAIVSKGRFDKSEPTIHKGEDLDIPTYIRRGVPLN